MAVKKAQMMPTFNYEGIDRKGAKIKGVDRKSVV